MAKHRGVFAALKKINEAHLVCADRGQDAGSDGKSQGRRAAGAAGAAGLKMEEFGKCWKYYSNLDALFIIDNMFEVSCLVP